MQHIKLQKINLLQSDPLREGRSVSCMSQSKIKQGKLKPTLPEFQPEPQPPSNTLIEKKKSIAYASEVVSGAEERRIEAKKAHY